MTYTLSDLLALLDLEEIEQNIFRGQSRDIGSRSVFGGQVLAQALVAAGRTVPAERRAHSLHGYFLLPGDVARPIVYFVDRTRDGKSFTTRSVVAIQNGRPIFNMTVSFQVTEPGLEHQFPMPEGVPPPEALESEMELARALARRHPERVPSVYTHPRPIEFRPVSPVDPFHPTERPPERAIWFRADGPLPDDLLVHQSVLAFASDYGLLGTSLLPHARSVQEPTLQAATLDHALWFHRPFRADEWLLYQMDSPTATGARGFTRGSIFTRSGVLVASTAQEGLIRPR